MPLLDKYTKGYRDSEYIEDPQYRDDNTLQKVLIVGAVAALGYSAYKSGALKPIIEKGLKTVSEKYNFDVRALRAGTGKWLDNAHLSEEAMGKVRASIFRQENLKGFLENIGDYNLTTIYKSSMKDIKSLKPVVQEAFRNSQEALENSNLEILRNMSQAMNNMELLADIKLSSKLKTEVTNDDINNIMEALFKNIEEVNPDLSKQHVKAMMDIHNQTAKAAQERLRKNGYRHLTIGDVFKQTGDSSITDFTPDNLGRAAFTSEWNKIKDNNPELTKMFEEKLRPQVEAFFLNKKTGRLNIEDITNLRIDSDIMVNSDFSSVIDMRSFNRDATGVVRSLLDDFQVPFINVSLGSFAPYNFAKEKVNFTLLTGEQKFIRNIESKDLNRNPLLFVAGKVFDSDTGKLLDEGITLKNSYAKVTKDKARKLAGLDVNKIEREYTIELDGSVKATAGRIARRLDIGYQDTVVGDLNLSDPNTWPTIIGKPLSEHLHSAKFGDRKTIDQAFNFHPKQRGKVNYVGVRKSITPIDVLNKKTDTDIYDFFGQFFAGRRGAIEQQVDKHFGDALRRSGNVGLRKIGKALHGDNLSDVTNAGLKLYSMTETLNSYFASLGLGMSTKNLGSTQSIVAGLLLKRFLPVYFGIKAWEYMNYESDNIFGFKPKHKIADINANTNLSWHGLKDQIGITKAAKRLKELMPGYEQISQIPGLGFLDMTKTREEKEEYYKHGTDPVRKGRYWSLGNTPYTGGKVQYFKPNSYRRTKSDWEYTDTMYGSESEYFKNAWFPTPRHPFAPVNYFVLDRYHYERKHYKDRPYMVSSSIGEEIPFIGPIVAGTIGRVIKPPKKMHLEYWQGTSEEDKKQPIAYVPNKGFTNNISGIPSDEIGIISPQTGKGRLRSTVQTQEQKDYAVITTKSGNTKLYSSDTPFDVEQLNYQIKTQSLEKTKADAIKLRNPFEENYFKTRETTTPGNIIETKTPYGLQNTGSQMYKQVTDMFGMHGFIAGTAVEDSGLKKQTIEASTNLDSFKRSFWDAELGGYGGELSEIFRRFIPKRRYDDKQYNPIRNTMPQWIPGEDYFTNFKIGDPYTKVKMGEIRLPGHAYEKINNIEDPTLMSIGSSSLGKSKEDIIKHLMNEDDAFSDETLKILDKGTKEHERIEKRWIEQGIAIDTERLVEDKKNKIKGWYDARVYDETSASGAAIVDIKTASAKRLAEVIKNGKGFDENVAQVNWYLHHTKDPVGYLTYALRPGKDKKEDEKLIREAMKEAGIKTKDNEIIKEFTVRFNYDNRLYNKTMHKLTEARNDIQHRLDTGEISRGDMYSYFDRFKILADVAPYSNEYNHYKSLMSNVPMDDKQKAEFERIKEQVKEQKNPLRLYEYHFKHADIQKKNVTVTRMLDSNTFLTKEFGDTPIKLAGIKLKKENEDRIKSILFPGAKVTLGIDSDPLKIKNTDTYGSVSAVVYKGNTNINKTLLNEGVGAENEDDWSSPGVFARFNPAEIKMGAAMEKFSHLDTMFHTKFLQVRSPLESYKRRHLYGKDFQTWEHPIRDYLKPAYDNLTSKNPVYGIVMGAFIGTMFGKTKFGKVTGAIVSASVVAANQGNRVIHEKTKQEKWIPKRRQKEREINEYVDMLKYVKAQRLYNYYADLALKQDKFDVRKYLRQKEEEGQKRKSESNKIKRDKKRIKMGGQDEVIKMARHEGRRELRTGPFDLFVMPHKEATKKLNKSNEVIANYREIEQLPQNAMRALAYYQQSKQTMYGYEKGDPVQNILVALPKTERLYFNEFINAPEKERKEILQLVPKYMRRPLESIWGIPVEEKTNLVDYFKNHQLPDENWIGWDEQVDMENVKVKIVKNDNSLSQSDFDIWKEDEDIASMQNIPVPHVNYQTKSNDVARRLTELLSQQGYTNIFVNTTPSHKDSLDMNLKFDQYHEIDRYIKEKGNSLI